MCLSSMKYFLLYRKCVLWQTYCFFLHCQTSSLNRTRSKSSYISFILLSNSPFLTSPGRSDGWYHHGDRAGPAWSALLPAGCLRKVPSSGWCQGVLRLRSACRSDLVGTKGKRGKVWEVPAPIETLEPQCPRFMNRFVLPSAPQTLTHQRSSHFHIWVKCVMT